MKQLFFSLAIVAGLMSCSKSVENPATVAEKATVKFYSTNGALTYKVVRVSVKGKDCGVVKYSKTQPDCGMGGFASIQLEPGDYLADYLDPSSTAANRQVAFRVPVGVSTCVFFDLK